MGGYFIPKESLRLVCDPDTLEDSVARAPRHSYLEPEPIQAEIMWTWERLQQENKRPYGVVSLVILIVSCMPLFWYLLLDRIRELSAAISGRES